MENWCGFTRLIQGKSERIEHSNVGPETATGRLCKDDPPWNCEPSDRIERVPRKQNKRQPKTKDTQNPTKAECCRLARGCQRIFAGWRFFPKKSAVRRVWARLTLRFRPVQTENESDEPCRFRSRDHSYDPCRTAHNQTNMTAFAGGSQSFACGPDALLGNCYSQPLRSIYDQVTRVQRVLPIMFIVARQP